MKKKKYIDNKQFTQDVHDFVLHRRKLMSEGKEEPQMNNKVGKGIWLICTRLASRPNFSQYSFREEMVSCAIEDCVKAVKNYDIDAGTRSGKPNAVGYFSQVAYWAMVRKIKEENKEYGDRVNYIISSGIESLILDETNSVAATNFVSDLKVMADEYMVTKEKRQTGHYGWSAPKRVKKKSTDLEEFMGDK
jgi:hypothetical protein